MVSKDQVVYYFCWIEESCLNWETIMVTAIPMENGDYWLMGKRHFLMRSFLYSGKDADVATLSYY